MSKKQLKKDVVLKEFWRDNARFAALFNGMLFQGREVLQAEQLEEVRKCIESGLNDQEIARVIENNPTAERMCKMREILLLMKKRKAGV